MTTPPHINSKMRKSSFALAKNFLVKALQTALSPKYSFKMKYRYFNSYVLKRLTGQRQITGLEVSNTYRCNARCSFCSLGQMSDFKSDMTQEVFDRLLADAIKEGVTLIVFLGGEALVGRNFFGYLDQCWAAGIAASVQTNGTLLTEETLRKLKESHIQNICITMHGDSPETHDAVYQKEGAFERVIKAVEFAQKNDMSITLKTIYSRSSEKSGSFYRILNLAEKYDLELNVNLFMPVGNALESDDRLTEIEINKFRMLAKTNPRVSSHLFNKTEMKGCFAGTGYFSVTANGDILPCYFLPIKIGNIMNTSLREADNIISEIPIFASRLPICFIAESERFYQEVLKPIYKEYKDLPLDLLEHPDIYELLRSFDYDNLVMKNVHE